VAALIEDYAIIGDTDTVALVDRTGSIDWWCQPRIDSQACFAALLGTPENGRWLLRPSSEITGVSRKYLDETLILETVYETATGTIAVIDFMAPEAPNSTIFRIVEGRSGRVSMRTELIVRFDYGSIVPWVRATGDGLTLVAGSSGLRFHSPYPLRGADHTTEAEFTVVEGQRRGFSLASYGVLEDPPLPLDASASLTRTRQWWREWVSRCTYTGRWRSDVIRSLITLKALTYAPTGAIVAAATTSLPESLGGVRNWDYRYTWLRDASLSLQALLLTGYLDEARAWSRWLRRAVAGNPGDMQIMYDVNGDRRLTEIELDWLPGYEGSSPVRIGNAAYTQSQLDVFGEVLDATYTAVRAGLDVPLDNRLALLLPTMEHLDDVWRDPDEGIWEIRGPRRHFTHSKVMAWVAYDRAIRIVEMLDTASMGVDVPVDRWRATRDEIHTQVCEHGFNSEINSFVQYYGSDRLDSSLLMLARVGFLPATDPRIEATVAAVTRELMVDGFVARYQTGDEDSVDGLPAGEGTFLIATYWLADCLVLMGRREEALAVFERLRGLQNDVGLMAEEYDPVTKRQLGNFPQAFSHLAFVVTAACLSMAEDADVGRVVFNAE